MLRFHLTFIALFLIVDVGWRVSAQTCENQTVQVCLNHLTSNGLDIKHIDDDVPTWNETDDMLLNRCKIFSLFSDCMSVEIDQCTGKILARYKGWLDAYNFLCKESNLTAVANYLQCFMLPSVNRTVENPCRTEFRQKADILTNGSSSIPTEKTADYCKLTDAFFSCLNRTLTANCGSDAANWQWAWDQKLSVSVVSSCQETDPGNEGGSNSAWTVALIVVLVLITAIMILAVIFLIIFLFRKKKERGRIQQARRRAHTAAPPPYSAVQFSSAGPGAEPQAHLVDSSVAVRASPQEGQEEVVVRPPTDVFLPPPYLGEQPPVPTYEETFATNATGDRREEDEDDEQKEENEETDTDKDKEKKEDN